MTKKLHRFDEGALSFLTFLREQTYFASAKCFRKCTCEIPELCKDRKKFMKDIYAPLNEYGNLILYGYKITMNDYKWERGTPQERIDSLMKKKGE